MVVVFCTVLLAATIAAGVVAAAATHQRAAVAADLAALAGADNPHDACAAAAVAASANGARLDRCEHVAADVVVDVSFPLPAILGALAEGNGQAPRITARSRAGPG